MEKQEKRKHTKNKEKKQRKKIAIAAELPITHIHNYTHRPLTYVDVFIAYQCIQRPRKKRERRKKKKEAHRTEKKKGEKESHRQQHKQQVSFRVESSSEIVAFYHRSQLIKKCVKNFLTFCFLFD